jgi:hypothetical protein
MLNESFIGRGGPLRIPRNQPPRLCSASRSAYEMVSFRSPTFEVSTLLL